MKTATVVIVLALLVWWLAPYLFGIGLAAAIVHKAGNLRRAGQARRDHELWADAMRRQAGPLYTGVNNPASPAWFDRGNR